MIYIRADANEIIGVGHIMRCLSIAQQLKSLQEKAVFIISDERSRKIIDDYGFEVICLNSQWDDLDKEIPYLCDAIDKYHINKILIDSYYVTENYLSEISKKVKTYYIDDINSMKYSVDVLINYNIYATDLDYEEKYKFSKTKLLLGTKYAPLRKEFTNIKRRNYTGIKKVLITSGGTDNFNVIGSILSELKDVFRDFEFYCIIGRFNKNSDSLREEYKDNKNIHILQNIKNIDYYMKKCDIAITAGGSTTYELCSCGTPSVLYTIADNQLGIAKTFSQLGIIKWCGDIREDISACIKNIIIEIKKLQNIDYWTQISLRMQETVDGCGTLRLANELIK